MNGGSDDGGGGAASPPAAMMAAAAGAEEQLSAHSSRGVESDARDTSTSVPGSAEGAERGRGVARSPPRLPVAVTPPVARPPPPPSGRGARGPGPAVAPPATSARRRAAAEAAAAAAEPSPPRRVSTAAAGALAARLHRWGEDRERRVAAARAQLAETNEDAECTFTPRITPYAGGGGRAPAGDVVARQADWAKRAAVARAARIAAAAAASSDLASGHTFSPTITAAGSRAASRVTAQIPAAAGTAARAVGAQASSPRSTDPIMNGVSPSPAIDSPGVTAAPQRNAVDAFVKRQARARALRVERETVPCADGSKFTGVVTR